MRLWLHHSKAWESFIFIQIGLHRGRHTDPPGGVDRTDAIRDDQERNRNALLFFRKAPVCQRLEASGKCLSFPATA